MAQQTAVDYLIKELKDLDIIEDCYIVNLIRQRAKDLEKQQHWDTWSAGVINSNKISPRFDDYYQDTFE